VVIEQRAHDGGVALAVAGRERRQESLLRAIEGSIQAPELTPAGRRQGDHVAPSVSRIRCPLHVPGGDELVDGGDDVAAIDLSLEQMIWRVVTRYAELSGRTPQVTSPAMYAAFDGLFQQALLRQLAGEPSAAADLQAAVTEVLPHLVR